MGNLALIQQRAHWGIENKLHWTLDVVFREDACRARAEHAAENLAIMRHIAHQVLGRVKKVHHCGYVVAQNIPFGEAEPEGRPSVGVRHVVGRGAREGGLREGGRLTKARGRPPRRGKIGLASLKGLLKVRIPAEWRATTIRKWWQWSRMVALVNSAGHWYFSS